MKEWSYRCVDPLRQEAHEALKKEFDTASKKSRADKLMLGRGVFLQQLGDRFLYSFKISHSASRTINADQPCILEIHGHRVDGDVHAVEDDSITLSLTENYGKILAGIDVVFDLAVLIDLVDRRLVSIDRDPQRFTDMGKSLLATLEFPQTESLAVRCEHDARGDSKPLEPDQIEAVKKALGLPFCLIWGPPGTGKTITLQGVLAELLASGKRVLFASNTNSAIDNVLEAILPDRDCPYGVLAELRERDQIVRLGSNAQPDVAEQFAPVRIAERWAQNLESEKRQLVAKRDQLRYETNQLQALLGQWEQAEKCLAELTKLQQALDDGPDTKQLEEQREEIGNRHLNYTSGMRTATPLVIPSLKRIEAAYKGLQKLYSKSSAASLLVVSKKRKLTDAREQLARVTEEYTRLSNRRFARMFRRSKIEILARQRQQAGEEAEAMQNALTSAETALNSVTERENRCLAELGRAATLLTDCQDELQTASSEAANITPDVREQSGFAAILQLLREDKNLLIMVIGEQLVIAIEQLMPSLAAREAGRPDPIDKWFRDSLSRIEAESGKRRQLERKLEVVIAESGDAKTFLEEHRADRPQWEDKLQNTLSDITGLDHQIEEIERKLETLKDQVVAQARMVAVTMVKASYDQSFENMRFDVLVVDEYSMVSLPQLYCVAGLVTERVVLCGDYLQLPPIAVSESDVAKKWLSRDFHTWHIEDESGNTPDETPRKLDKFLAKLETQRRMPPEVSRLVRPWYRKDGNKLIDGWIEESSSELDLGTNHPLLQSRIVILDTTSTNAYSSRSPRRSYHNLVHVGIAGEICRQFLEDSNLDPEWIRYLTPYRDQAGLTRAVLRQLLRPEHAHQMEANVSTVHQSQGRGTPIVIYDMTDGIQKKRVTWFHRQEKPNLLNVALTRTKARLIIICAYQKMRRELRQEVNSALSGVFMLLDAADDPVPVIDAKPYADKVFKAIQASDLFEIEGVHLSDAQRASILVLRSEEYYIVLAHDLEQASESILIVSPFITQYRVDKMLPLLEVVAARSGGDVRVDLITRHPEKMFDRRTPDPNKGAAVRKLLDLLVDVGANVTICPDAHDKLVVIDNRINYWGSLNPLSFRDTREINTRLEAEGLSKQFIAIARSGRSWPYVQGKQQKEDADIVTGMRAIARSELKQLRWLVGPVHGRPPLAVLWNDTIESLVTNPPKSWAEYRGIAELRRRNCVLMNHLEEVEDIIYPLRGYRLPKQDNADEREGTLFC